MRTRVQGACIRLIGSRGTADDGGRGQRIGGGVMRCKGEEDIIIWVSFPQIPMYAYISSARFVYARRKGITTWAEGKKDEKHSSQ